MSSVDRSTETQNEITQRWIIFEANILYSPVVVVVVVVETLQTPSKNYYLFGGGKLFVKTEIDKYLLPFSTIHVANSRTSCPS